MLQSHQTLCDVSPPGSSVHGILQARILEIAPISLTSPALASGFFTTSGTWSTLKKKNLPVVRHAHGPAFAASHRHTVSVDFHLQLVTLVALCGDRILGELCLLCQVGEGSVSPVWSEWTGPTVEEPGRNGRKIMWPTRETGKKSRRRSWAAQGFGHSPSHLAHWTSFLPSSCDPRCHHQGVVSRIWPRHE